MVERPETIPNRVSIDQASPHFTPWCKKIGVKIDGQVMFNVHEFCVSEGWAKLLLKDSRGRYKKERGRFVTAMVSSVKIETYWRIK